MAKAIFKKKQVDVKPTYTESDSDTLENLRNNTLDNMMSILSKSKLVVYKLNDPNVPTRIRRVIPSGLPSFDIVSARTPRGSVGLPIGRQIEVSGPESSGKTSLACLFCASAQSRLGWNVVWLEHENKFDPDRASTLGMDVDKALFLQPNCLEDSIEIIDQVMDGMPERNELPDNAKMFGTIIVVDSVASMPSRVEIEGEIDANNLGVFQRKMSQAQRRITNRLSKRNITIVWINQERDKLNIGGFGRGGKTTYGGHALRYYCAQRWKLWCQKNGDKGIAIHIVNTKNQCGIRPFLETQVKLDFSRGFDYVDSWIYALENLFILEKKGQRITFKEGELQGQTLNKRKLEELYEENPQMFKNYEKSMKEFLNNYATKSKSKKSDDETTTEE